MAEAIRIVDIMQISSAQTLSALRSDEVFLDEPDFLEYSWMDAVLAFFGRNGNAAERKLDRTRHLAQFQRVGARSVVCVKPGWSHIQQAEVEAGFKLGFDTCTLVRCIVPRV